MTAIELVIQERRRQKEVHGWTEEHDDTQTQVQLARAGRCYVEAAIAQIQMLDWNWLEYEARRRWPWGMNAMPDLNPDPIRNLTKAAALLVAEIERLQRLESPNQGER